MDRKDVLQTIEATQSQLGIIAKRLERPVTPQERWQLLELIGTEMVKLEQLRTAVRVGDV